jgi:hypothetical protein
MSFLHKKQRRWNEIVDDPQTPFMIGRLLGANEMAVALLSQEDNETAKRVAKVLESVNTFFNDPIKINTGEQIYE